MVSTLKWKNLLARGVMMSDKSFMVVRIEEFHAGLCVGKWKKDIGLKKDELCITMKR